jgi:hypothetical protein
MRASTFVSAYLKADILRQSGPRTFTVHGTEIEEFKTKDGDRIERKLAVIVDDGQKFLLNKNNTNALIELFGSDETDAWKGKRFVAYYDPTITFGGKKTGGLRVRAAEDEKF